jgi:threonine/homoserine/homoserine lactone efflux protein
MSWLVGFLTFGFAVAASPGPNNALLWASGTSFGFRRTLPHVLGTALGLASMALAAAAGLGALITALPGLAFAMKLGGSAYLLYLALQIGRSRHFGRAAAARPLSFVQGAAFQLINPKAWVFALGAVTTFRPADLPVVIGSLAVAAAIIIVVVPSASLWAAAGELLGRLLSGERAQVVVSVVLAILVVATVVSVWL